MKPDDVWLIGSDGKPMTATLIAKLVDRGKLSWTTQLSEMLPMLAKDMRAEYRTVTLLELLSHRAGLPHDVSDMPSSIPSSPTSGLHRNSGSLTSRVR